jgi:hypothetical protein
VQALSSRGGNHGCSQEIVVAEGDEGGACVMMQKLRGVQGFQVKRVRLTMETMRLVSRVNIAA